MDILGGQDIGEVLQSVVNFVIAFSTDFFAFLVVAGLILGFAFYFGRDRILALIAGIYAAVVLYQAFPYASILPNSSAPVLIALFIAFVVAGWLAFSGMSFFLAKSESGLLGTAILSAATAGLLIAVGIHVLPLEQLYTFSVPTKALFESAEMFFWWLVAPLVALFFFGK